MGKNILKLDTSSFTDFAEKLDALEADLKSIFTKALTEAGQKITTDTEEGMKDENLPAHGAYHHDGRPTEKSIIQNPQVKWSGMMGEMGVGFDFGKPGAGGYLITGTPKMKPDRKLNEIYKSKRYMVEIKKGMVQIFNEEIKKHMGG